MALIRNASGEDKDTVHRVQKFNGRRYTTYCGQEINLSNARPANQPGLCRCPQCHQYYRINLGNLPAAAQTQAA